VPLRRSDLLFIFGFWTFIALLTSANALVDPMLPAAPVALTFIESYLWAVVTPLVFSLTSYYPLERGHILPRMARLVVFGMLVAVAMDVLTGFLRFDVFQVVRGRFADVGLGYRLRHLWFMNEFLYYIAILAGGVARDYFLRYQSRREQAIRLETQAAQLQVQLADARLAALRTQLNPHFLFNTLHAVTVLIREDPAAATRVVTRLGDLLRLTLSRATTPQVSFRRELELLTLYLEIERTRFHDRLEIAYDVQPATLGALVPDLILQPLVENAIRHGVSPNAGTGRIEVRSRRDGEWLNVEIRDNGAGLTRGHVRPDGIGLTTTRARLERLYNDQQELTLVNLPEGGCVARIRIPFQLTTEDRGEPLVRPPLPATSDAPLAAAGD